MRTSLTIFLMATCFYGYTQVGGRRSFEFVNIPTDAYLASMGGVNVSLYGQDVNFSFSNPALMADTLAGYASASFVLYPGHINIGSVSYLHNFNKTGLWSFGAKFINYGEIDSYDPTGALLGDFNSNELTMQVSHTRMVGVFSVGATLKFLYSNIANFNAYSLVFDLGGAFRHPIHDLSIGMVIKNLGFIVNDYTEGSNTDLPFDAQIGISYKPTHMPVRFSTTIYNLYEGNLVEFNPDENGDLEKAGAGDKIFSHFTFGSEIIIRPNFNLRLGYNHLRRREFRLDQKPGTSGLSFGFMFKVKSFEMAYTRSSFNPAGGANNFTVSSNINRLWPN